jgi:hypothetical protein
MNDGSRTLLDFGIGASVAAVPVLIAVLVVVAWFRPLDTTSRSAQNGERHISVRHVAALKTFESAIVRRRDIKSAPVTAQLLLEGVPACRKQWDGRDGLMAAVRRRLAHAADAPMSPAERIAAQLAQLDAALDRFSAGANRRVADPVGFDAKRWFDAVASALAAPAESNGYPGRGFVVQCSDIASAVATLTRGDARMLDTLAWRGTEVQRVIARWRPEQVVEIAPRQVARANPWSGIAGCVYMGRAADGTFSPAYSVSQAHGLGERICREPSMRGMFDDAGGADAPQVIIGGPTPDLPATDARWAVPPSLDAMLRALDTLQRPTGALYRLYTERAPGDAGSGDPLPFGLDQVRARADAVVAAVRSSLPAASVDSVAALPRADRERLEADRTGAGYAFGPNRIDAGGALVDVGFSVDITIDPALQTLAQKTAACYTGRQDVCQSIGMHRKEDEGKALGHRLLEHAMVRMAAVAIIDVATGRIEALAGALSPCTRQEYDGPGRATECDRRLPYPIRYRPDALLNAAVYHDAMPASVIKPIMATAFLADSEVGARWLATERAEWQRTAWPTRDSLRGQLMRSDSARFLDRMFCADKGFANCARPWNVQATAAAFGWNADCAEARDDCGKRDLLFGRAVAGSDGVLSIATVVPYGRLLVEPMGSELSGSFRMRRPIALDPVKVRACAAGADGRRGSGDDWEKCRGGIVVDAVAEGWGQGNARSSALGVAGMMSALAAAANGDAPQAPHLVQAIRGASRADGEPRPLPLALSTAGEAGAEPKAIPHDAAELILNALSYSHRGGTARLACEQVFDARACRDFDWIAGKTGTPTFPNDDVSLDELSRVCASGAPRGRSLTASCGALRPYKWYVAAYRTDSSSTRWSKVIGVLTERNWMVDNGRIHGAGDHGPNPAAEIALQIASRHAGRFGEPK